MAREPLSHHPLRSILRIAETSLTVSDLAVRDLWHVYPGWEATRTRSEMEELNLDYAPVLEDPVHRYVDRFDLDTGTVEGVAKPIDAAHLASGDLGLADGLALLAARRFFFVIEGHRVVGIVGLADVQRQPVSMVLFALIIAAEAGMSQLIAANYEGEVWLNRLGTRRARVEELFLDRQRRNAEITRLECLMLEDRLRLVCRLQVARTALGFESRSAFDSWSDELRRLRDPLAHGGSVLDTEPDPEKALGLIARVRRFAERVWDLVESPTAFAASQSPTVQDPTAWNQGLERLFHRAMVEIYERAKQEAGYTATRFVQMVSEHGGLGAAKTLLHSQAVSEGFTALWERGRLDLTVERYILRPEFEPLFSEEDREIARTRLRDYGLELGDE